MPEEKNIYVAFSLPDAEKSLLEESLLPAERCSWFQSLPEEEHLNAFLEAEVVFGNVSLDWIEKSDNLCWLQLYSAGVNPYQELDWSKIPQITVTNLRNFFGQPVAETAVAGIMALYRKIDELARLQAEQKWVGGALRPQLHLLHRKKALVLGGGAIGSAIEKILTGFSCDTKVITRTGQLTLADLDELLPWADLVINNLPETEETIGVISAHRLGLMKSSAIFANVGRGSAVDEPALIEALHANQLAGAMLDVSAEEPLPQGHPLWTCPNVLLTQHTGGGFAEEDRDKVRVFTDNLRRYRAGEPLQNVVDFSRGY
ncbi:D-2-hydroxyacid dehydrogenase [soil metagenome]